MNHAVIMAGGVGTRFWPHSRQDRPKQFLRIAGDRPMIAETCRRLEGVIDAERVLVVTRASQVDLVKEACPDLPAANILAEPCGRNTAPCIALAALKLLAADPDAAMLCLPADHVIGPDDVFRRAVEAVVARAAASRALLTFGIPPTRPATGFGYVEQGELAASDGDLRFHRVVRFVEKPDLETARGYLESGRFHWNSGMFAWRADVFVERLEALLPDTASALAPVAHLAGPDVDPALAAAYDSLEGISVDYGIMERADGVEVVPAPFSWDDVGSWSALDRVHAPDADGNVALGELLALDSKGLVAVSGDDHVIATVGVDNLVIIHTRDVTLVCPKERAEDVKRLVDVLGERGHGDLE
jgi:mannose-1-phosphate guanylyltransferase